MTDAIRWSRAWSAIGASPRDDLLGELRTRHSEPGRAYHTLRHVEECLVALETREPDEGRLRS